MAAGIVPPSGTEYGPCDNVCEHLDCSQQRKVVESECRICDERIGHERRYYNDPLDRCLVDEAQGYVHAACLEDEVEADRKARTSS